jgi:hypothetical protein
MPRVLLAIRLLGEFVRLKFVATAFAAFVAVSAAQTSSAQEGGGLQILGVLKETGNSTSSVGALGFLQRVADGEARIGGVKFQTGREFVQARVEEDGLYFEPELSVSGYKGQIVEVVIWSNDGRFLGERRVTPLYDNTIWNQLKVFVPWSRLRKATAPFGYTVYAVPLDRRDEYIGRNTVNESHASIPAVIWEGIEFNASGSDFTAKLALRITGHQNEQLEVWGLVRDRFYHDLSARYGGPIKLDVGPARPAYDDTEFASWEFKVPYSMLAKLAPAETVILTPALEIDGKIVEGNVHYRFLAAGSIEQVEQATSEKIDAANEEIQSLQRAQDILRQGKGP